MNLVSARRNQGLCIACGAEAMEDLRHLRAVAERKARETGLPVARFLRQARCGPCDEKHSDAIKKAYERKVRRRQQNKLNERERRKRLLADGLCVRCGKHPKGDTTGTCECCKEKICVDARRKRERRRNAGVCIECGRPLELLKYVQCQKCRDRNAEILRARKARKEKESTA